MHIRQMLPLVGLAAALCACSGALAPTPNGAGLPVAANVSRSPGEARSAMAGAAAAPSDPPSPASAPDAPAMRDPRDLQIEIMTEAVAALRHELARSYGHSQKLTEQGERLRALVTSLRTELGKQKRENKVLQRRLEALERRLQEMVTPPPEGEPAEPASPEESPGSSSRSPMRLDKNSTRADAASTAPAATTKAQPPPRKPQDRGIADRREGRSPLPGVESE